MKKGSRCVRKSCHLVYIRWVTSTRANRTFCSPITLDLQRGTKGEASKRIRERTHSSARSAGLFAVRKWNRSRWEHGSEPRTVLFTGLEPSLSLCIYNQAKWNNRWLRHDRYSHDEFLYHFTHLSVARIRWKLVASESSARDRFRSLTLRSFDVCPKGRKLTFFKCINPQWHAVVSIGVECVDPKNRSP